MQNFSTSKHLFSRKFSLKLNDRILDLSPPVVMGILNATPDSFYEGSRLPDASHAVEKAKQMVDEGAAILDLGAVSTRPGAEEISEEEELDRLGPIVEGLRQALPEIPLSIDTFRAEVARSMHQQYGIQMVNDISAGRLDPKMFTTMAELQIPYVMMHMQGTPQNMQDSPEYEHVTDEIVQFFSERVFRLRKLGVSDIIIDPGFGFGKSLEQNYQLLRELDAFAMLELPVLAGLSRKSMIYRTLGGEASEALNGTTAAHMAALMGGARILRVHDVKEAVETVKIFSSIFC